MSSEGEGELGMETRGKGHVTGETDIRVLRLEPGLARTAGSCQTWEELREGSPLESAEGLITV